VDGSASAGAGSNFPDLDLSAASHATPSFNYTAGFNRENSDIAASQWIIQWKPQRHNDRLDAGGSESLGKPCIDASPAAGLLKQHGFG
jgi:hypothetical protein